jgi:hypothetical protein
VDNMALELWWNFILDATDFDRFDHWRAFDWR